MQRNIGIMNAKGSKSHSGLRLMAISDIVGGGGCTARYCLVRGHMSKREVPVEICQTRRDDGADLS